MTKRNILSDTYGDVHGSLAQPKDDTSTKSAQSNSSTLYPGAFPSRSSQPGANKDEESIKRCIYPSPIPSPTKFEESPKQRCKEEEPEWKVKHPYLGLLQMTQPSPIPSPKINYQHGDVDPGDVPISHERQSVSLDHDIEAPSDDDGILRGSTAATTSSETQVQSSISTDPPMLVAELAPNEDDVAARVALQVQQQLTSEWQRLRQEVQAQLVRAVPPDVVLAVSMEDPTQSIIIDPTTSNAATSSNDGAKKHPSTTIMSWRQRCGCGTCGWPFGVVSVLVVLLFLLVLGGVLGVVFLLRVSGDNSAETDSPSTLLPTSTDSSTLAPTTHEGSTEVPTTPFTEEEGQTFPPTTIVPTTVPPTTPTPTTLVPSTDQQDPGNDFPSVPPTPTRPSDPPTMPPSPRRTYLLQTLGPKVIPTNSTEELAVLQSPLTPQGRALQWLSEEDDYSIQPETMELHVLLERYALAVLYFSTSGDAWLQDVSFLDGTKSVCDWNNGVEIWQSVGLTRGVYCEESRHVGQVTYLMQSEMGMAGTLPWEISLLEYLVVFYMEYNALTGSLPSHLGDLQSLDAIWLHSNALSGSLPSTDLPPMLHQLLLTDNDLSGNLASEWANVMPDLEYLLLGRNQLTGTIASEVGSWEQLIFLDLEQNQITGTIPTTIGLLTHMERLDLQSNRLSGTLPTEMGNLSLLTTLYIFENPGLSGSIPSEMSNLGILEDFLFEDTSLTGSVDELFCDRDPALTIMGGDCRGDDPEIECSCCTYCCSTGDHSCIAT